MSRRQRKPYHAPYVLEIGEPKGDTPEAIADREKWHAAIREAAIAEQGRQVSKLMDTQLDAIMRELWASPAHWLKFGMLRPPYPYPGLAIIRRMISGAI